MGPYSGLRILTMRPSTTSRKSWEYLLHPRRVQKGTSRESSPHNVTGPTFSVLSPLHQRNHALTSPLQLILTRRPSPISPSPASSAAERGDLRCPRPSACGPKPAGRPQALHRSSWDSRYPMPDPLQSVLVDGIDVFGIIFRPSCDREASSEETNIRCQPLRAAYPNKQVIHCDERR